MASKLYAERTRFQYLDIIISSGIIKRTFFERCQELNLDPYSVAISAGISLNAFKEHYVKNPIPSATHTLPQEKFIKMLEIVGIDIKVSVIKHSVEDTIKRQKERNYKIYDKNYNK